MVLKINSITEQDSSSLDIDKTHVQSIEIWFKSADMNGLYNFYCHQLTLLPHVYYMRAWFIGKDWE